MRIEIGTNEAGQRLDKFARKLFTDIPMSGIYKALRKGDIKINEKKAKENYILQQGDIFTANKYVKSDSAKEAQNSGKEYIKVEKNGMKVIYEDKNALIVEKWPGVDVQSDIKSGVPSLTDFVLTYLEDKGDYIPENELTFRPSPCNRLDVNTSGMVIYGKNFQATKAINEVIRERKIEKYYLALVKGRIKDGRYDAYIKKNEASNMSRVYAKEIAGSKRIAMEVTSLKSIGAMSLIEINLITGKSHQIRAHLNFLGNPIVGDKKYGDKELNNFFINKFELVFQYLYAYKYKFGECTGVIEELSNKTITAALPPLFKSINRDVFRF